MALKKNRAAVVIAALIAILFILPWTRNVLLFQLGTGFIPGYVYTAENPPRSLTDEPQDLGQALEIGQRESAKAKSILVYRRLIEKYPDEPALYANVLRYACMYGPLNKQGRPEAMPKPDPPTPAAMAQYRKDAAEWRPLGDSPELRMVEDAIAKGRKLDPENACFDMYEAVVRFSQKRDAEALSAIHRAAGKREFNNYMSDEFGAALRDTRRAMGPIFYWISPMQRVSVCTAGLFPNLARFRQAARTASWCAVQDVKAGRTREAIAITSDVIKMSGVMEDQSQWAIDAAVAEAMERSAVQAAYESLVEPVSAGSQPLVLPWDTTSRKTDTHQYPKLLSAVQAKVPDALSQAEWQSLNDRISRSAALQEKMSAFFGGKSWSRQMYMLIASLGMPLAEGTYLSMAIVFGALWLVTGIWLARRGQRGVQAGPGRLSVWLLAIVPTILALIVMQGWGETPVRDWFGTHAGPDTRMVEAVVFGLRLIMVALVAIIAFVGATRIQREDRWNGFLSRLRTGSAYAAQSLLVLYLITLVISIPLVGFVNRGIDRWVSGEMQMVRDYNPPAK